VKAAFLYNFAKYVAWPVSAFSAERGDAFRICVLTDSPLAGSIDAIIAGETIDGRRVIRQTASDADAAGTCHILFVARNELERFERLRPVLRQASVLTVGEGAAFVGRGQGGAIGFVTEAGRVRFDVSLREAQQSGLSISSRLLRIARRVDGLERR
jgi:hypothetical protein